MTLSEYKQYIIAGAAFGFSIGWLCGVFLALWAYMTLGV